MDKDVQAFVNPMVSSGLTTTVYENQPYLANGSGPGAHPAAFYQRQGINKEEVRPDVYDIVSRSVNPATLWRSDVPPEQRHDGYWRYDGNSAFNTFSQRKGINNVDVDPEVWGLVNDSVNPATHWRSDVAPEQRKDGYFRYDGNTGYNTAQRYSYY